MILSTVALLAGTGGVLAGPDAGLPQPVDQGVVTAEAARDTMVCDLRVPADPRVGVADACPVSGASIVEPAPVTERAARRNPHATTPIRPASADVTTARRNPHATTPIRPAPADEASLPIEPW